MAGRNFAMLSFSLTSSKKIRSLDSDGSRWAYICAHLSELSNYSGMFRYPVAIWASDAGKTSDEILECIADLSKAGLVEYDFDEETVRIVSWFHKKNAPENASRMMSLIGDYSLRDFENSGMYCRSVSEFIVGSVRRSQGWKPDSAERPKLREAFKPFIGQVFRDEGEQFLMSLNDELQGMGKAVQAEVEALFMPLMELRMSLSTPPCGQGGGRVGSHKDVEETRRDLDGEREEEGEKEKTATLQDFGSEAETVQRRRSVEGLRRSGSGSNVGAKPITEALRNSPLARG